jgi:serine/threonine protein kinase
MPWREGSLTSLASAVSDHNSLCEQTLEQMLSALDFLASKSLCHRDVKPDNILFSRLGDGRGVFQLADFGLANHQALARTFCGTKFFQAPELYYGPGKSCQSPKMDVWSLFVTILFVHPNLAFPPPRAREYNDILQAVRAAAVDLPALIPMARESPERRASAAQLLVAFFGGRGLTTPREEVPARGPCEEERRPIADKPMRLRDPAIVPRRLQRNSKFQSGPS